MRRPILLDNPPPQPAARHKPSDRWSQFLHSKYTSTSALAAGGVAAVIGASVALAVLLPYAVAPQAPTQGAAQATSEIRSSVAAVQPVAAKPVVGNGVQYVGDVKQADRPCEEQTWPYIAKQCLKPAAEQKPANTTAKVAVDRSELKTVRAALPSPVVKPEQPAVAPQAELKVVAAPMPVAEPVQAPLPAARPAPRQAARDQAAREAYAHAPDAQPKRAKPAAREARDIRPEAQRTATAQDRTSDRNPSPVVRRWTEAEYDVAGPFGTTRRVMVIRQQPVHQAAAFSDER